MGKFNRSTQRPKQPTPFELGAYRGFGRMLLGIFMLLGGVGSIETYTINPANFGLTIFGICFLIFGVFAHQKQ